MNKKLLWKRIGFYFLSFTWGFITSFVGLIVIGIAACFKRVHVFHGRLYAVIGKDWGGLELGCFFVCCDNQWDEEYNLHLRAHESGHGIQNIIFGPLMPFIVMIPSAVRYWYREWLYKKDREKYYKLPDYDAIWFEGWASALGHKYVVTDRI